MEKDRVETALARLAAAAERIKASTARQTASPESDVAIRYAELKAATNEALQDLDDLIASIDR